MNEPIVSIARIQAHTEQAAKDCLNGKLVECPYPENTAAFVRWHAEFWYYSEAIYRAYPASAPSHFEEFLTRVCNVIALAPIDLRISDEGVLV
jgi:hypothetical protein